MNLSRLPAVFVLTLTATAILAVILALFSLPEVRAEGTNHHAYPPMAPTPAAGDGPWVVRAYFTDQEQVARVASRIEPWEVHYDQGFMVLEVNPDLYRWLLDLGLRLEFDQALTAELNRPRLALPGQTTGIPGYPCYRTVEETFAAAQTIANNYPNLAAWIDIGDSWKRVAFGSDNGYDMLVLRLTNALVPGPKPKLFIISAIHAREYATAELNTQFAEYLVSNYGIDPDATWLLDYHEIHLLLEANPDGRERAESGLQWRKNVNNNYCADTDNRGADLNRNFEFQWGYEPGSSGTPCDPTYRGLNPVSEPEVQAMQAYMRSIFPDQREAPLSSAAPPDATGLFIDLHSWGELVLWPWGFTEDPPPNSVALGTLGRKFAWFNGYTPGQSTILYPTAGTTDDFTYGELGVAGYTFELGNNFFQSCSLFENAILPDNLQALIYAAKVARTPYLTPSGPDSLSVVASPENLLIGSTATLSATIDDTRYSKGESSQPIAAAEYYVDIPPWVTGATPVPITMAPSDGSFDETSEDVSASIDTPALGAGRHILYVRGQDSAGNWGPFSAAFLSIYDERLFLPLLER